MYTRQTESLAASMPVKKASIRKADYKWEEQKSEG